MNKIQKECFPHLIDAEQRNSAHPLTFLIGNQTANYRPNDYVKIGIDEGGIGERFWVEIIHADGKKYVGRVDNELFSDCLNYNDKVVFESRHIMSAM